MVWLRAGAVIGLLAVAVVAGGAFVRVAVVATDPRGALSLGLVGLAVVMAIVVGAGGRRWRRTPYW